MNWIGIDSASLSGWAFRCSDQKWCFGTVRADSPQKYDVLKFAKEHGCTHACIEKPAPFTGSHAGVASAMNISYGRWLEACEREGIIVVPVLVSQWQSKMLVVNGAKVTQKQFGDPKFGSKYVAKHHGANVTNGDEADAVLLALFGPTARVLNAVNDEAKRETRKAKAKASRRARKAGKK